jgi:hypothetical protein
MDGVEVDPGRVVVELVPARLGAARHAVLRMASAAIVK